MNASYKYSNKLPGMYSINLNILTGIRDVSDAHRFLDGLRSASKLKKPFNAQYRQVYSEVNNYIFIYTIVYFMTI